VKYPKYSAPRDRRKANNRGRRRRRSSAVDDTVIVALLLHAALTGRYGLLPERELCEYVRRRNWFDEAVNALAASGYLVDPVAALTGEESAQ
jgi:hypothetical protein